MSVLPGSTQTSSLVNETTGLVGTLAWRLLDSSGGTIIASATSSITEGPTGTYRRDYTAPSTVGLYQPVWNDGTDIPDTPIVVARTGFGSSGFVTVNDLSDYLGRDVTADNGAALAVESACEICRTVSEQQFDEVTMDTITLDGSGTDCLLLPELPVTAAGTVVVNGGTVTDYVLADNGRLIRTSGTASGSQWSLWWDGWYPFGFPGGSPSYNRRLLGHAWPLGRQNVVVTYDHGGSVPSDVRMVALSLASRIVVQGVAVQEQVGDVNVRYAGAAMDLSANELRILRKHRPTR